MNDALRPHHGSRLLDRFHRELSEAYDCRMVIEPGLSLEAFWEHHQVQERLSRPG
ncbi:MAG: hypothetical protein U5R48_18945 [Gammaproteobacteria bacterium]|nr:hypothetical protein [Gammaproteobacteria bacterium]